MAFKNCKYCGHEISEKAKKCPTCGRYQNTKHIIIVICIVAMCVICSLIIVYRNNRIKYFRQQAEQYYSEGNFEKVALTYDNIEKYFVDLSEEKEILQYDMDVHDDVIAFHEAVSTLQDDIHNGKSIYSSISTFSKEANIFDDLKINKKSEYGKYIDNIKNVSMYPFFKTEFMNNNSRDYDSGLVKSGYVMIIDTYLDEILSHELPYNNFN